MLQYWKILLPLVLVWTSCKEPAETVTVTKETISESVYASGVVKSKSQYQVFSTASGLINKILVKVGDSVKKGDALVVIASETARLQAENAKIGADFAESSLRGERLAELRTGIETARAKMLNDSILLQRQKGLWAQQIGSKFELEQRELALTTSSAALQSAIFRYNDLQKQLAFASEQSRKQLSISKNLAADFTVRSQTDGRVYSISKEVGELVDARSPLAIIGAADDFLLELQVDEKDIVRIRNGQRVLLSMDSYENRSFEAVVTRIDPLMNERTRSFTVEANFVEKPPVLYPFLNAEANIVIKTKEQALILPRNFVLGDTLVVLEGGEMRRVETGLRDYRKIEILKGLDGGERVEKPKK